MNIMSAEYIDKKKLRLTSDIENFRYIFSHDLRKPLRLISYNCSVIREDNLDMNQDDGKKAISSIESSVRDMQTMIDAMSDYVKLEIYPPEISYFSVHSLILEVIAKYTAIIEERKIKIVYDQLPEIYASRANLLYIFTQLLDNAIKFCNDLNEELEITITYEQIGDYHYFTFTNNNEFIEEEYYEIIFILFQRMHTQEEALGYGIGLALSKKMIECIGGRMWIESNTLGRNKFIFTIPVLITINN